MKYIVTKACYGFQGRYWDQGEEVELYPKVKPPIHFAPVKTKGDGKGGEKVPSDKDKTAK